jgi:hypothetical protein
LVSIHDISYVFRTVHLPPIPSFPLEL